MVIAKKFNIDEEAAILLGGPANKKMTRERRGRETSGDDEIFGKYLKYHNMVSMVSTPLAVSILGEIIAGNR